LAASGPTLWGLIGVGDGWYKIVDRTTGKVLDVPHSSAESDVPLMEYEDNGGENQLWKLEGDHIVNRKSGLLLAPDPVNGLKQSTDDGSAALRWQIMEMK